MIPDRGTQFLGPIFHSSRSVCALRRQKCARKYRSRIGGSTKCHVPVSSPLATAGRAETARNLESPVLSRATLLVTVTTNVGTPPGSTFFMIRGMPSKSVDHLLILFCSLPSEKLVKNPYALSIQSQVTGHGCPYPKWPSAGSHSSVHKLCM